MESWVLTICASGRHSLFRSEGDRRRAVHALARVSRDDLGFFGFADDHVHLLGACPRAEAGQLARRVSISLRRLTGSPLEPAHPDPVKDRRHLEYLVGYFHRQSVRHGLRVHPALWTGSSCPDLLGIRCVPELRLRFGDLLPRFGRGRIAELVGLAEVDLRPASLTEIQRAGASILAGTAAAALAAGPDLGSRVRASTVARRAASSLGRAAGIPTDVLADALGLIPRTVRRLSHLDVARPALEAVRRRLTVGRAVREGRARRA
jgi:hypothetical protein